MTLKNLSRKLAIPLIAGSILSGCSNDSPKYTLENQTLQGWYRSGKEIDSPTVLVFDSVEINQRRDREPQYRFVYNTTDPEGKGLKQHSKYNLVVDNLSGLGNIIDIKSSE